LNAECVRMDREESCVEKSVQVLHQEDAVAKLIGTVPSRQAMAGRLMT
jgi:hypothetical protein